VELKLHIDPARDRGRLFPLLMAVGTDMASATNSALASSLAELNASIEARYKAHAEKYKKLLANSVSIETPDKALNEAFQWAVISIEQLRTHVPEAPGNDQKAGEIALVAGYYASGDSARPGFGWFFGRDALYTLYAVNGYGDFALSKSELEFLIRRQRDDGKIMHEYSQTAARIDWKAFPYMYAAADATPLFLLADC
jgi:glycogen debranching enzyme